MKKIDVRCWQIEQQRPGSTEVDTLFISYPEDNSGHSLITCLTCGEIFAVTVAIEVYVGPPLEQKLQTLTCPSCGTALRENWTSYPEKYVSSGHLYTFHRRELIPPDESSMVKSFYGIYESQAEG